MEKLQNKQNNLNNGAFKNIVIKHVKHPVLNVFVGDFKVETVELSQIFSFKCCNNGDSQILHLKLNEDLEKTSYKNDSNVHIVSLNCKDNISKDIREISPKLINQICIISKQYKYVEKGKLSINIILSANDSLYVLAKDLLEIFETLLKKAFINGIDVSIFNVYEENFDISLNKSQENIFFIKEIYDIARLYPKIVSGIYFISNYDNDEVYTDNSFKDTLFQLSLYIEIKTLTDREYNENYNNFSEKDFLYISNYLKSECLPTETRNCCAIGVSSLIKPNDYIKRIIELAIYDNQSKSVLIDVVKIMHKLKLDSSLLISQLEDITSSLTKINKKNQNLNLIYVKNRWDKMSIKYDMNSIKKEMKNKAWKYLDHFTEEKIQQINVSLYSLLKEENFNLFTLDNLILSIVSELYKERKNFCLQCKLLEKDLDSWQETEIFNLFPGFIQKKYFNSNLISLIDVVWVNKWKKLYLDIIQKNMIIQLIDSLTDHLNHLNCIISNSLSLINSSLQKTKEDVSKMSSKLDVLQIENTINYYYKLTSNLLDNGFLSSSEFELFDNVSYDADLFNQIAEKIIDDIKKKAIKIYIEYVSQKNYFEEYRSRLNLDKKDAYIKVLEELHNNNSVKLRVIDNEKIHKTICISLPSDFEVDDEFIMAIKTNRKFENIKIIKNFDIQKINVFYVNGNIDMNDVFHF